MYIYIYIYIWYSREKILTLLYFARRLLQLNQTFSPVTFHFFIYIRIVKNIFLKFTIFEEIIIVERRILKRIGCAKAGLS